MGELNTFRVLITDDHPLFRRGFAAILSAEQELNIVGEAKDGQEAVRMCGELRPDLVVMDISMPNMDGIEATREVKKRCPKAVVLVVTAHEDENLMLKAIRAGAVGFFLKGKDPTQLIGAVREALEGESPMDSKLAGRLLRRLAVEEGNPDGSSEPPVKGQEAKAPLPVSLSPREQEVLGRVAEGKTNRLIAQELHMSLSTMKRHLERIVAKLGVSDRTQAAVKAIELGVLRESVRRK
ncbi:MAG TPA: response regulator transcription factor [Rubrobacteraceae bacterium]|nr:response regulator transcription factor [Rubrobacteraceae bacterium]